MDLKAFSLVELKALVFDKAKELGRLQRELAEIEREIDARPTEQPIELKPEQQVQS